jgi:hypothetical protein
MVPEERTLLLREELADRPLAGDRLADLQAVADALERPRHHADPARQHVQLHLE